MLRCRSDILPPVFIVLQRLHCAGGPQLKNRFHGLYAYLIILRDVYFELHTELGVKKSVWFVLVSTGRTWSLMGSNDRPTVQAL